MTSSLEKCVKISDLEMTSDRISWRKRAERHTLERWNSMAAPSTFQLVGKVLSELYADVQKVAGTEKAANDQILARMQQLSDAYAKLTDATLPPIDYSDAVTRFGYIYTTVTANSDFVFQALTQVKDLIQDSVIAAEKVVLSCLGGGPGSELIGFLKFILQCDAKLKSATCYLVDREQAWADSWTDLGESLEGNLPIFTNFQMLDVLIPSTWAKQRKFLGADLFIASYFASELMRLGEGTMPFWKELFSAAHSGSMILVVDFDADAADKYITSVTEAIGWKKLYGWKGNMTLTYTEDKKVLGDLLTKFGNRTPRLRGKLDVRLLQKP